MQKALPNFIKENISIQIKKRGNLVYTFSSKYEPKIRKTKSILNIVRTNTVPDVKYNILIIYTVNIL